ncbi:hypothetical protein F5X98DRAFT_375474 [Xylaria grammica]|nr:hypothetical protein F5X98DRAFT_375474 [Xylaria grammica]
MSAHTLASSAPRAAIRGASLTRTQPRFCAPSLSINTPGNINVYTLRCYGIGSSRSLTTGARLLSSTSTPPLKDVTSNTGKNGSSSQSKPGSHQTSGTSEDDFKISFRDLGMNRITKFVVYTMVGVLGTMETIFWCKAIWRWWKGGEVDE